MRGAPKPTLLISKKVDNKLIAEDFKKYEDKTSKKIKPDSFEKMGLALGVDIYHDIFIMYFLYKCQCKTYGEITEDEYTKGLTSFGVNSLSELKPSIIRVKEDLLNITTEDFKNFYQYLFNFSWDKRANPTGLPLDIARLYFEQLFGDQFKIINEFVDFAEKTKKVPGLTKDQWFCFLELLKTLGDQFPKGYNVEESWPTMFDEFYEFYCKKNGIKIDKPEYY